MNEPTLPTIQRHVALAAELAASLLQKNREAFGRLTVEPSRKNEALRFMQRISALDLVAARLVESVKILETIK